MFMTVPLRLVRLLLTRRMGKLRFDKCRSKIDRVDRTSYPGSAARSLQAHKAPAIHNLDRLGAARHSKLLEEMRQVGLDGALADIQIVGDLLVGLPVRKKAERRHFPGS